MRLRAPIVVFLVPIAVTLALAVAFSLSSLLATIFFFSIGLPLAAIAALFVGAAGAATGVGIEVRLGCRAMGLV